jgi:glycosyltransferase involved in cell wall biosynthesis
MTTSSLHVITSTQRRGAETFATELAAALTTAGDRADVVALTPGWGQLALPVPVLGVSRRSPMTLRALRRLAAERDVVVAHGSSTLEACAVALLGHPTPFVYRSIGDPTYWVTSTLRRRGVGVLHRCAARHVALWDDAANELVRRYAVPRSRIDVIANAVAGDRWRPADLEERATARRGLDVAPDRLCLAFVGALSVEKDVATVVEVGSRMLDVTVLIVGAGPDAASLRARAAASEADIRFLGALTDPRPVYAAADLLLLPSRSEGMPGVIIEAGLTGTATVATAVGGVPALIDDGGTGFLAPPGDPAAFLAAVRSALPTAIDVGRRAADEFVQRYTMDRVAPLWSTTLREVAR